MRKRFFTLPGGRVKRLGNRWGGDDGDHYAWCALDRRRTMRRILDREFTGTVAVLESRDDVEDNLGDERPSTWTVFEPESGKYHSRIFVIEGEYDTAVRVYAARNNGRHPEKVSCDCGCGADYRLDERYGTLAQVTMSVRNCRWTKVRGQDVQVEGRKLAQPTLRWDYHTLDQFLASRSVTVIRDEDITDEERNGKMPVRTTPSMYTDDEQTLAWLLEIEM